MSQLRARIASLLLRSRGPRACLAQRSPPALLVKEAHGAVHRGIIGLPGCSLDSSLISQALQKRLLALFDSISMASTTTAPCESGVAAPSEADLVVSLEQMANGDAYSAFVAKSPSVIFVLGGPGSGKGTQCALIVEKFGFTHLSAGDLLRAEINSGSENGTMIQNMIKEGKIVPSEVTVKLLQKAMQESGNDKFLIDGFPRNEENRAAFELVAGIQPKFILFFDCSEEEMEKRLLGRNQGRVDDNIETIRKRFKVFVDSSLPVINYYESLGKVRKIDAARTRDEVFESIQPLFLPFIDNTPAMELNNE